MLILKSISLGKAGPEMKNKISNNLGWKIVSLIASVMLWMVVNTVSNPSVTQTYYNIPVRINNIDKITSSGKVYEILDGTDVIPKVTVKAPRAVISELDADDIIAVADINNISKLDTISIELSTGIYADQINSIKGNMDTVKLKIENRKKRSIAIGINTVGNVGDGYLLGNVSIGQNVVNITGAESLVDTIEKAVVEIDVEGFTSDIVTSAEVRLYNKNGQVINNSELNMNIKSVPVQVDILETRTIPVYFSMIGNPMAGFMVKGSVESDRDSIEICGKSSVIKNISQIDVPKEVIDITDKRDSYTADINIKDYLPDGISLVNNGDGIFKVSVTIERVVDKAITITTEDIEITGVPDGYKATAAVDTGTELIISGLSDMVSPLRVNNIKPTVDLKKWIDEKDMQTVEEGFYTIEVSFDLTNGVVVTEPVKAVVHIVKDKVEE